MSTKAYRKKVSLSHEREEVEYPRCDHCGWGLYDGSFGQYCERCDGHPTPVFMRQVREDPAVKRVKERFAEMQVETPD